jgi:hypothetical protein
MKANLKRRKTLIQNKTAAMAMEEMYDTSKR